LSRARATGVREMLVAGIDVDSSRAALSLARRDGVYAAAGIHPNECATWSPADMASIRELITDRACVAVGETGLDFYRDAAAPDRQREAFAAHIALALEHAKALVIHTRDSVAEALDCIEAAPSSPRHVWHCWSGDDRDLRRALDLGGYISFAGNLTFARNGALRALVRDVPADRLLVETDSPYLSPEPRRGRPNEPANVRLVGGAVAEARGAAVEEIARLTRANARRLFAIEP
jgi:TatD DNase family protein